MKTIFRAWCFVLLSFPNIGNACGICGAMMPGYVLSSDRGAWISLGYRADQFGYFIPKSAKNSMIAQHLDLQFKYTWRHKVEFQALLPYQYVKLYSGNYIINQYQGVCDVSLIARRIYLKRDSRMVKRLAFGLGLELPSGNFRSPRYEPFMQPGSGTIDGLISVNAGLRNRKSGLSGQFQLKLNGVSKDREHRANSADIYGEVFREYLLRTKLFLQPKASVFAQYSGKSRINGVENATFSDQYNAGMGMGLNAGLNKWFLSINARISVVSNRNKSDLGYLSGCNLSLFRIL